MGPFLKHMISVIVPIYNEKQNLLGLLRRLNKVLLESNQESEIIFIDDHSTDGTWEELLSYKSVYNFRVFQKEGQKGKAFSLIEGFKKAQGDILVMIDSDLQYPPEAIVPMVKALEKADIAVANRKTYNDSRVRKLFSRTFKFAFGKLLFGLDTDIQSGLKAMKREVFETVKFDPKSQWTFDLEFLHRANHAGFKITNVNIIFKSREKGDSSINILKTAWEIGTHAAALRTKKIHPVQIPPAQPYSMQGAGIAYKKQRYITHSTLPHQKSALHTLSLWQKLLLISSLFILISALLISFKSTLLVVIAAITLVYFIDVLFNAALIFKSLNKQPEINFSQEQIKKIDTKNLPTYTILCPLYKEADVLPHFIASIESMSWPKDKLEVLLLLEEDDVVTQKVAQNLFLPRYFKIIIVPAGNPKTKPKACNYGLHFASGKYLVIYDAEDRPDPFQLKKAHLAFEKYGSKIACYQAKLNYYNTNHNLLTRFFTAEYSLWFGVILPALQSIGTTIPLGGTSNHFRTADIHKFEGWDPFNVTEDADLGVRLFKAGYKTAILDSTTYEEANSKVGNWLRQRSRWIKGYMQTFLVHNRDIHKFAKNQKIHALLFQLIIGGKIIFVMLNPFMWFTTIAYFVFRPVVGPTIEQFYPGIIFYMAAFCLIAGNFLYLYYYMIGVVKQGKYSIVKFIFGVPFYWFMISTAFWIAAYQLIFKPHYWEKTVHGLHFDYEKKQEKKALLQIQAEEARGERIRKIRNLINSGTAAGGFLVGSAIVANFFNFLYNAYLGRTVSVEDFGLVSLVGSFFYLSTIPIGALSRTVTHRSAFLLGKYETPAKIFWAYVRKKAIIISVFITILWLAATPLLQRFFQAPSWEPFILFAPVWLIGLVSSVDSAFLAGNLKFKVMALLTVSDAVLKFAFAFILVNLDLNRFIYGVIPASMAVSFLIGWVFARKLKSKKIEIDINSLQEFPSKFFASSILTKIASVAFISFDVILAKHYLSPTAAGEYALISLVGKMIFFIGGLFSQFIIPLVGREEGAQRESKHIFMKLFLASTLVSFVTYVGVGLFGFITIPLLFGKTIDNVISFLPLYGFAMFCFTVAGSIVAYHQSKNKHLFPVAGFLLALTQIIGIVLYHSDLSQIVWVMTVSGVANLAVMLFLHFAYRRLKVVASNLADLGEIFSAFPWQEKTGKQSLKILIFNWRDTKHIWGGGAEVYIHEIARRLVKDGNSVTLFCGNDGHHPRNDVIDGIQIVRRGGFYTVYVWAFLYYILKFRGKYDIIIDSENGIPFFTPLYTRTPVVGLVHHVHQEVFRGNLAWPLAVLGKFLEGKVMPVVYRNVKMITVSESSKEALEKIGFGKKNPVEIINPGVDNNALKPGQKTVNPSILYLGRLKPYKSIETAIKAMPAVLKKAPKAKLIIAGEGESRIPLENMVEKLNLKKAVRFLGRVSEETKARLLSTAWVMVQPSKVEGWGITAIEANASGTPVIASDVPGLRDSVKNPHSGLLITWDNLHKWEDAIINVLKDKKLRDYLNKNSLKWSKQFSWDTSAERMKIIIKNNYDKR